MTSSIETARAVGEAISGGPEVLESLAPEWRQLCDEGLLNQDPFCRPEWSIAYTRAYEVKNVLAITARVDGRLRAVLPLVRERASLSGVRVRMLRRPDLEAPRFDVALTRDETEAAAAVRILWRCLRDDSRWDVIELAPVPQSGALWRLMAEADKDGFPTGFQPWFRTPIIPLSDLPVTGEDPWLARTSHQFSRELRRKTRRLLEKGCLRLERFERATPEVLERYCELERATWKGEIARDVLSDSRRLQYYNEISRAAERNGHLSIFFLMLDDHLIAANFAITCCDQLFALRCAFDPAFSPYSPGQVLINWALRDCAARKLSGLDFCGEAHDWKLLWTSQTVQHGYCYIFRRGLFGRALHTLKFRAVPLGRELLRRPLSVR